VAEILGREIPLLQALGIEADWQILRGDGDFFSVTNGLHNGLHGGRFEVTPAASEMYLRHNEAAAATLTDAYDVYVVHDRQPAALCRFRRRIANAGSGDRTSTARRRIAAPGSSCVRSWRSTTPSSSP
jgi:trehalose synthase